MPYVRIVYVPIDSSHRYCGLEGAIVRVNYLPASGIEVVYAADRLPCRPGCESDHPQSVGAFCEEVPAHLVQPGGPGTHELGPIFIPPITNPN